MMCSNRHRSLVEQSARFIHDFEGDQTLQRNVLPPGGLFGLPGQNSSMTCPRSPAVWPASFANSEKRLLHLLALFLRPARPRIFVMPENSWRASGRSPPPRSLGGEGVHSDEVLWGQGWIRRGWGEVGKRPSLEKRDLSRGKRGSWKQREVQNTKKVEPIRQDQFQRKVLLQAGFIGCLVRFTM